MTKLLLRIFTLFFLCQNGIGAITIEEKKAGSSSSTTDGELTPKLKTLLEHTNADIMASKAQLRILYDMIARMRQECAPEESYEDLLISINNFRQRIRNVQNQWRQEASSKDHDDNYSLWHQPETTIGQLVDDYASEDFIYISTPEISKIKISVDSNLPIPRSSWEEILELILNQNGVGIRQINPFLRELYLFQNDNAGLRLITSKREDLEFLPQDERVAFVLTPDSTELKRIWFFLNRFVSPTTTTLQLVGREILIIARNSDIQELLKVYDFVCHHKGNVEYKAVKVSKVNVEEMAKTLAAIFDAITDGTKDIGIGSGGLASGPPFAPPPGMPGSRQPPPSMSPRRQEPAGPTAPRSGLSGGQQVYGNNSLKIFALREIGQALVLVGTKEEIYRAEEIIRKVEEQVGDPHQKVIFWYTVKHSDPEELAQVLARIYDLMIETGTFGQMNPQMRDRLAQDGPPPSPEELRLQRELGADRLRGPPSPFPSPIGPREVIGPSPQQGFFLNESNYLIDPDDRHIPRPDPNFGRNNFIVDLKTSALVMVVESDLLADIKDLIKRLDVPKKMVQIEIMLVEQVLTHNDNVGLNLLNIGCLASQTDVTSFSFNPLSLPLQGITDFIISRPQSRNIPAYDIAYQFLISRDDVRINASPSVLTVNQTPATIEIEKEISVSTGTFLVPNGSSTTTQQSFARARYGIKIDVTPTVHMSDAFAQGYCDNLPNYITLDSDIKFETIVGDFLTNNQPPVIRRALKNQARVADGQTIIIGGFRRKDTADLSRAIPFLGEIPGFGKLFSSTRMSDEATEMFLFMTSKIVSNPEDELEKIKMEEMARRAGDLPYFTKALQDAREQEQNELFQGTLRLLFGRKPDRTVDTEAMETRDDFGVCDYDGR